MSYTDTIKIQNYLQRTLNDYEKVFLSTLLPAIKKWIDQKTGSTFDKVSETTRYYDGGGSSVDLDPCTDVTAVSLLDNEGNIENAYVANTDYSLEPVNENVKNEIVRRHGCYPIGSSRVAVTAKFSEYDHGVPEDIQVVATRIAGAVIKGAKNDAQGAGLKQESLEGHSVTYASSADDISTIAGNDPLINSILQQHTQPLVG